MRNGIGSSLDYLKKRLKGREISLKPISFLIISMCFYYFLLFLIEISKIFRIFAHGFRICTFSKTYCSIVTQSPPLIYEQTFIIGTATQTGAAFPYLKVVCGEPCDVWRMSAPFLRYEHDFSTIAI